MCAGLAWGLAASPGWAVLPDEMMADPALEARAREISKDIRCLVCQNQSIDDSNADLARDLRLLVRDRLKAGDNDEAVIAYLTARYGDFVRLRPPFQPNTWLLWLGPPAVLVAGATGIVWRLWSRRAAGPPEAPGTPLSADEWERLRRVLGSDGPTAAEPQG